MKCPGPYVFVCSSSGSPTCELLGLPLCKLEDQFSDGTCLLGRGGLEIDEAEFLEIVSTPKLPKIIELPLVTDEFVGKIGFAYIGSNPSFEVKLSFIPEEINVVSVDLEDSDGNRFENIPFKVTNVPSSNDRFIFTITIPDEMLPGESNVTLHFADGKELTGIIQIIDPYDVEIVTIRNPIRKDIGKPVINRIIVIKRGRRMMLRVRGFNFASRKILYAQDDEINFSRNKQAPDPHTSVTIYPSDLHSNIKKRIVRKRSKFMRIHFILPERITEVTDSVLVIATPEGITSASFLIKPKKHRLIINVQPIISRNLRL